MSNAKYVLSAVLIFFCT